MRFYEHNAEEARIVDLALIPWVLLEGLARLFRVHLDRDARREQSQTNPSARSRQYTSSKRRFRYTHCCQPSDAAHPPKESAYVTFVTTCARCDVVYAATSVFAVFMNVL